MTEVDRRRLLEVLSHLSEEVRPAAKAAPTAVREVEPPPGISLSAEDERLVAGLRAGLARLAGGEVAGAVGRAIDGAEFVARADLLGGDADGLGKDLPGFVFLVLLPQQGKVKALRVADRAADLLARPTAR